MSDNMELHEYLYDILDPYRETIVFVNSAVVTDYGIASLEVSFFCIYWTIIYMSTSFVQILCWILATVVVLDFAINYTQAELVKKKTDSSEEHSVAELRVICEGLSRVWKKCDTALSTIRHVRETKQIWFTGLVVLALLIISYVDSYVYAWGIQKVLIYILISLSLAIPYLLTKEVFARCIKDAIAQINALMPMVTNRLAKKTN